MRAAAYISVHLLDCGLYLSDPNLMTLMQRSNACKEGLPRAMKHPVINSETSLCLPVKPGREGRDHSHKLPVGGLAFAGAYWRLPV